MLRAPGSVGRTWLLTSANDEPNDPAHTKILNLDIILLDNPSGSLEVTLPHDAGAQSDRSLRFLLIDTRVLSGTLAESAVLAAGTFSCARLQTEFLAAQELMRDTQAMFKTLRSLSVFGFAPVNLHALIYRHNRTEDTRQVSEYMDTGTKAESVRQLK